LVNAVSGTYSMLRLALEAGNLPPYPPSHRRPSSATDDSANRRRRSRNSRQSGGGDDPPGCTMDVLALDGIFLDEPRRQDHVFMPPGGRVELAVRCAKFAGPVQLVTTPSERIPLGNREFLKCQCPMNHDLIFQLFCHRQALSPIPRSPRSRYL
jgi:hypothetical protein